MAFVADASVSLRWLLPSQADAQSTGLLARAEREGLWVPGLWHLEIANQLGLRLRSGKLSQADFERAHRLLSQLAVATFPIAFVSPMPILSIMERFGLTAYDAVYLDFARTHDLPLATFDHELITAAQSAGIRLLP